MTQHIQTAPRKMGAEAALTIERLWRSLKYECVYLPAFETGSELRAGLTTWITYHNANRPHSGPGGQTPNEAYGMGGLMRLTA